MMLQLVRILWWGHVITVGALTRLYSYFPNRAKSWLVVMVKEGVVDTTREVFRGSDVQITAGHCYLGGVIGSEAFEQHFFSRTYGNGFLISRKLSILAELQPHAAYSAYYT